MRTHTLPSPGHHRCTVLASIARNKLTGCRIEIDTGRLSVSAVITTFSAREHLPDAMNMVLSADCLPVVTHTSATHVLVQAVHLHT